MVFTLKKTFKSAFKSTLPVLAGYLSLGLAFGILMVSKGLSPYLAVFMSVIVFAGSMQFVAVDLLAGAFQPLYAFLLTIVINARHIMYGISMLGRYKNVGGIKPYLIFGLTDETFSILCAPEVEEREDKRRYMLFVTLLDHSYWVMGTLLGVIAGSLIGFDSKGIDFVMVALFTVIVVDQWRSQTRHLPAIIGAASSLVSLFVFGPSNFIIPAMILMSALLCLFKKRIEGGKV